MNQTKFYLAKHDFEDGVGRQRLTKGKVYTGHIDDDNQLILIACDSGFNCVWSDWQELFIDIDIEKVIELLCRSSIEELSNDDDEDWCINDYAGGNMDDAYSIGVDHGYVLHARDLMRTLFRNT